MIGFNTISADVQCFVNSGSEGILLFKVNSLLLSLLLSIMYDGIKLFLIGPFSEDRAKLLRLRRRIQRRHNRHTIANNTSTPGGM